jgi:hypothetical protein
MSAKLKHSDMNLFEFASSIKLEPEPIYVPQIRSQTQNLGFKCTARQQLMFAASPFAVA